MRPDRVSRRANRLAIGGWGSMGRPDVAARGGGVRPLSAKRRYFAFAVFILVAVMVSPDMRPVSSTRWPACEAICFDSWLPS